MNYTVIAEVNLDNLISEVNEYIKNGYNPIGGISIMQKSENYKVFYQALIKN